jgi:CRP-like cAMP-binding protein
MAALIRAYGISEEHSTIAQAKLRIVMPALVSFISSCLSDAMETTGTPLVATPPVGPSTNRPHGKTSEQQATHAGSDTAAAVSPPLVALADAGKLDILQKLPCFQGLDEAVLKKVSSGFEARSYAANATISHVGDPNSGMHVIVKGSAQASVMQDVGVVSRGEAFGEQALMSGQVSNEALVAKNEEVVTLWMNPQTFKDLHLTSDLFLSKTKERKNQMVVRKRADTIRKRADTVRHPEMQVEDECPPEDLGVPSDQIDLFIDAIRNNDNIKEVLNLSNEQIVYMATLASKKSFSKGQVVFQAGEVGDALYIVAEGAFNGIFPKAIGNKQQVDIRLRNGDSFGELSLLYDARRFLTVKCSQDGFVWKVTKTDFASVIDKGEDARISQYMDYIKGIPLFQDTSDEEKRELCEALEEKLFHKGQDIVTQGDPGSTFYLIFGGSCDVLINGEVSKVLATGGFFGEKALIANEPRGATVRVTSSACSVLCVDQTSFSIIKQSIELRKKASANGTIHRWLSSRKPKAADPASRQSIAIQMRNKPGDAIKIPKTRLVNVGFLGEGSFGFVTLQRDSETMKLYALKAMSKGQIVQEHMMDLVQSEVQIMKLLNDSRFVVKLCATYRDALRVYLLLEPSFGGELLDVFHENKLWKSEEHARFYAASVSFGLDHLHARKVIYRDLKLENCLLSSDGQLKLADMGIAKIVLGKTYTICGTADYFAPETLRKRGHNRAVDWWALGVLIFIMTTGTSPFEADDVMEIYKNIVKGFAKVVFPSSMSTACKDIIMKLGQKKPEERLTMQGGIQEIQTHEWLSNLDWTALAGGNLEAPWRPENNDEDMAAKIAARPPREQSHVDYEDDGTGWDDFFDEDQREVTGECLALWLGGKRASQFQK